MTAAAAAAPAAPALQTISGRTAVEIAESVRELAERGLLSAGDTLPSVRALAEQLGITEWQVPGTVRIEDHVEAPRNAAGIQAELHG